MQRLRGERAMTREQALRKVMACLRLAGSSNPNEAASALRQAHALMAKYGLTEDDAAAAEIHGFGAPTRSRGQKAPQSVLTLANVIAAGYGCITAMVRTIALRGGKTEIRFYGPGVQPKVAAYAFTVLRRQLETDKLKYVRRVRRRANKVRRGEEFSLGWVYAIAQRFPVQKLSEERERAINRAIDLSLPGATTTEGRQLADSKKLSQRAVEAGVLAGRNAQLHDGLSEDGQRRLEHA